MQVSLEVPVDAEAAAIARDVVIGARASIPSTFPSPPPNEWGVGVFDSLCSCRTAGAWFGTSRTWCGSR